MVIGTILVVILAFAISYLLTAGFVWVLCWALPAIGITVIGGFVIVFSWKLALAVWIVLLLLRSLFTTTVNTKG